MDNKQPVKDKPHEDKPATNSTTEEIISEEELDNVTGGTDSGTGTGGNHDYSEESYKVEPYVRYTGSTGPG